MIKLSYLLNLQKRAYVARIAAVHLDKVHSVYQREIQDIPMPDKQTILLLNTRKMFCLNKNI